MAGKGGDFSLAVGGGYNFKIPLSERGVFFMHILRGAYESLAIPLTEHGIYNAGKCHGLPINCFWANFLYHLQDLLVGGKES